MRFSESNTFTQVLTNASATTATLDMYVTTCDAEELPVERIPSDTTEVPNAR